MGVFFDCSFEGVFAALLGLTRQYKLYHGKLCFSWKVVYTMTIGYAILCQFFPTTNLCYLPHTSFW